MRPQLQVEMASSSAILVGVNPKKVTQEGVADFSGLALKAGQRVHEVTAVVQGDKLPQVRWGSDGRMQMIKRPGVRGCVLSAPQAIAVTFKV